MAYFGMYKCRLCGEKYIKCSVSNAEMVIKHFIGLTTPNKALQQINLLDMHSCKGGNFGLADFQGFKNENK